MNIETWSTLFSGNEATTRAETESRIEPTTDVESSWVEFPPSENLVFARNSTENQHSDRDDSENSGSLLKLSLSNTFGSLVSSFLTANGDNKEELHGGTKNDSNRQIPDGNKSVASVTESDSSQSQRISEQESDKKESNERRGRGRSPPHTDARKRSSSRPTRRSVEKVVHIKWFAHGTAWTCLGIIFGWLGVFLAFLARASTEFATVEPPIYFDPNFDTVSEVGMINLKLCFNETYIGKTGCTLHELSSDDVDDMMFQLSRSVAFLAILFGGMMSAFLSTAVFWNSINLRPVGGGFLIAYFFQSFSFLFFDANLCNEHKCRPGPGAKHAIVASICWVVACVATARMDSFKYRKQQQRRNRARRRRRSRSRSRSRSPIKKAKKAILNRKASNHTTSTDATNGTIDIIPVACLPGLDNNNCFAIEGIQDIEAAEAWIARSEGKISCRQTEPHEVEVQQDTHTASAIHQLPLSFFNAEQEEMPPPAKAHSARGRSTNLKDRNDSDSLRKDRSLTRGESHRRRGNISNHSRGRSSSLARERSTSLTRHSSHQRRGNISDHSRERSSSLVRERSASLTRSSSHQRRDKTSNHPRGRSSSLARDRDRSASLTGNSSHQRRDKTSNLSRGRSGSLARDRDRSASLTRSSSQHRRGNNSDHSRGRSGSLARDRDRSASLTRNSSQHKRGNNSDHSRARSGSLTRERSPSLTRNISHRRRGNNSDHPRELRRTHSRSRQERAYETAQFSNPPNWDSRKPPTSRQSYVDNSYDESRIESFHSREKEPTQQVTTETSKHWGESVRKSQQSGFPKRDRHPPPPPSRVASFRQPKDSSLRPMEQAMPLSSSITSPASFRLPPPRRSNSANRQSQRQQFYESIASTHQSKPKRSSSSSVLHGRSTSSVIHAPVTTRNDGLPHVDSSDSGKVFAPFGI